MEGRNGRRKKRLAVAGVMADLGVEADGGGRGWRWRAWRAVMAVACVEGDGDGSGRCGWRIWAW